MQKKRIQNRIAESRWTQAWVVSAAMLVWIVAGLHSLTVVAPGVCLLLATYLMMELNNANALIRIYSRMVSCSFIVLATMAVFMFPSIRSSIVMLGMVRTSVSVWQAWYGYRCYTSCPYFGLSHAPTYSL